MKAFWRRHLVDNSRSRFARESHKRSRLTRDLRPAKVSASCFPGQLSMITNIQRPAFLTFTISIVVFFWASGSIIGSRRCAVGTFRKPLPAACWPDRRDPHRCAELDDPGRLAGARDRVEEAAICRRDGKEIVCEAVRNEIPQIRYPAPGGVAPRAWNTSATVVRLACWTSKQ